MTPQLSNADRNRVPRDYYFVKIIGEGSFSTVYLAVEAENGREFAIKVLKKRHIIREKKMEYVNREKKSLLKLGGNDARSKYFVHLYATFQDPEHLYFVLTYARNGEMLEHLSKHKTFKIDWVKYYAAELLMAIEFLKLNHIIHRDLKPENILIDKNGHILVTDFGSSKIVGDVDTNKRTEQTHRRRKNSFVGTAQYVSPEVLHGEETSYASDLWALGCLIYQMTSGQTPFRAASEYLIFQKVTKLEYQFAEGFDLLAKDLIEKLLVITPENRLGATDPVPYTSLREHSFFNGTNWNDLGPPPELLDDCDKEVENIVIPKDLKPGLNDEIYTQLHVGLLSTPSNAEIMEATETPVRKKSDVNRKITDLDPKEIEERLKLQAGDEYNRFVEGNLILKKGVLEKKKGLFGFARRRMFLLTLGPRLYYVDPSTMTLKGEVPWSADVRTEAKNFKVFYVHTPNRTYYLEDPNGYALEWCKEIEEVITYYFPKQNIDN